MNNRFADFSGKSQNSLIRVYFDFQATKVFEATRVVCNS